MSTRPAERLDDPARFGRAAQITLRAATTFEEEVANQAALAQHTAALEVTSVLEEKNQTLGALAEILGVGADQLRRKLHGKVKATLPDVAGWRAGLLRLTTEEEEQEESTQVVLPENPEQISSWLGQVWDGDCLPLMAAMPAASVDLILADLPYGTTRNKWDSIIPLPELWAAYERVLKPTGCIVLTAAQPFTSALVMSRPEWYRYEWIWRKTIGSGQLNIHSQPLRVHESALVFAPKKAPYFPQMTTGTAYSIRRKATEWDGRGYNQQRDHETVNTGTRWPKSVLDVPNPRIKGGHPTQKPVELFEYLVKTHSEKGGIVLDNVLGSGTTAVAAAQSGREWIGMENDPRYVKMSRDRVADLTVQTALF